MTPKFQFNTVDLYCWDGVSYNFLYCDADFAYMRRSGGSDAVEKISWVDINEIVADESWDIKRRSAKVIEAMHAPDPYMFVWELPKTQRTLVLNRWFFVLCVEKLHSAQKIKFTPKSVEANEHILRKEVEKARSAFESEYGKKYFSSKSDSPSQWPNACTILGWKRIYRASGRRIESLKDHRGKASSIDIDQESYVFITSRLREFLTEQRHSGNEVIAKTIMEIEVENTKRVKNNQTLLQSRCRSVLHEWLKKFGQFAIMAGREGLTAAKREYSGVGKTERATRPGECFQIDEWEVDARTFIMSGPLREGLDKKTLAALPRGRRWMYIVIDVATRYVVGFALSASQNPEAAVRSLRMATKNKDHLAKAAGAKNGWDGMQFESLQSDTGSAFFSEYTHRAVSTAYATYFFPQVGEPHLRGIIERIFSTFTDRAMPYIPARTYSNPQERGDYDTEARVTLTDDQLASVFIRYIVDVYHQSLHFGLYEETPQNAYNRLVGTIGKPPELPKHIHRRAFGIRVERVLTRKGFCILGIDFHSKQLVGIRKKIGNANCPVYVDPDSLGTVSAYVKGEWVEVPNSIEDFRGISVAEWNAVGEILRRRYAAEARVNFAEILEALNYIRSNVTEAQKIAGTLPPAATSETVDKFEKNLWHGLSVFQDKTTDLSGLTRSSDGLGYVIGVPAKSGQHGEIHLDGTLPASDFAPEIEVPIEDDKDVDDDSWWQQEGDDDV